MIAITGQCKGAVEEDFAVDIADNEAYKIQPWLTSSTTLQLIY